MATCQYCGSPAGFFRRAHAKCEEQHRKQVVLAEAGRKRISAEVLRFVKESGDYNELKKVIAELERTRLVPPTERNSLLARGWEDAVGQFLDDGIFDRTEESRLARFRDHFSLSQSDLDKNGALTRTVKAAVLRDLLDGVIPQRAAIDGDLHINFQKGEQVVWAFPNSRYLEDKTRRQFVGGSQGVSIRVMKGVYYRVGAFKGHAVENTERVIVDKGWLVTTSRNIYFAGPQKSLRLPYAKIVSFQPYSDGIGVMRDASNAKAQTFVTGDGWFTYNLVTNLARIFAEQ